MKARIQKWGNSLALRIPKPFAAETHLEQGVIAPFPTEPRGDTSHLTSINQYLMLHSNLDE